MQTRPRYSQDVRRSAPNWSFYFLGQGFQKLEPANWADRQTDRQTDGRDQAHYHAAAGGLCWLLGCGICCSTKTNSTVRRRRRWFRQHWTDWLRTDNDWNSCEIAKRTNDWSSFSRNTSSRPGACVLSPPARYIDSEISCVSVIRQFSSSYIFSFVLQSSSWSSSASSCSLSGSDPGPDVDISHGISNSKPYFSQSLSLHRHLSLDHLGLLTWSFTFGYRHRSSLYQLGSVLSVLLSGENAICNITAVQSVRWLNVDAGATKLARL